MRHFDNTAQFYRSDDWANCKTQVLYQRIRSDGIVVCEHCGKPIVKGFNPNEKNNKAAMVFHHKIFLNNSNVNDASISINPDNIAILHWNCHNEVHGRFGFSGGNNIVEKKVYIITGASCSGKTTFVKEHLEEGDIVCSIDDIYKFVSGQDEHHKPNSVKPIVFKLREELKGMIARGTGTWRNAYIIESLPSKMDLERECERYKGFNVEVITMDATKEECLERLHNNPNGRDIKAYEKFIQDYFDRLS